MNIRESVTMAFEALRANKFRSILTTLGIVIGVLAVIGMQTIIAGLNRTVEKQLAVLGAGTFYVQKEPAVQFGDWEKYQRRKDITLKEVRALEEKATLVKVVAPEVMKFFSTVRYKGKKTNPTVYVFGGNEFWQWANGFYVQEGRFVGSFDVAHNRQVCVLGLDVVETLFPFEDPIGKDVLIDGNRFTVIGVFERKGKIFGQSQDNVVLIPISTFHKIYGRRRSLGIALQARDPELLNEAIDQVIGILRMVRKVPPGKPNDFEILTKESLMQTWKKLTRYIFLTAVMIAGMSLLVGGIGIMNIMLVSVTERTREIGIRKAIGAKRRDVLWQFIVEAVILSEVGGVIGVALGVSLGKIVGWLLHLPAAVPIWSVFLGLGFSSLVGLFFGIYPASKAARLNPIEALRYE